jgi:hypothetical protein
MNKHSMTLVLGTVFLIHAGCFAAEALNPAQFIIQRGWKPFEGEAIARSPSHDLKPILFYEKGNLVPSCGLIAAVPGGKEPNFIALVGSDPGVDYPQCLDIRSMVPFRLQNKDYIAVEYVSRDTREDSYRGFHYVHRDAAKGYITDKILTAAVPNSPGDDSSVKVAKSKTIEGVKLARSAYLAKAFPLWHFLDRDFISDKFSSFAILTDKKTQQCHFVVEAGAAPVTSNHIEFAPGARCISILASSRLEKSGTIYYIAIFKSDNGKQVVAIMSVDPNGKVMAEKTLSDNVNRSGATKDIKSAKVALSNMLR